MVDVRAEKIYINEVYQNALQGHFADDYKERIHLGGGVYITISAEYPTVDIRHFWKPEGSRKIVATRNGVALNKYKWEQLCKVMELIHDLVPELEHSVTCYLLWNP